MTPAHRAAHQPLVGLVRSLGDATATAIDMPVRTHDEEVVGVATTDDFGPWYAQRFGSVGFVR